MYWDINAQPSLGFTENGLKKCRDDVREQSETQGRHNYTIEDWKNISWSDEFPFQLNIQMIGSECGVNYMRARIHPALYQRFRLLVV